MAPPEEKKPVERLIEAMDKEAAVQQALSVICAAAPNAASRFRSGPFTVIVLRHAEECVLLDGHCVDQVFNDLFDHVFTKDDGGAVRGAH